MSSQNYEVTTLGNGLKVVTVPMQERESAAVAIWVRTGGRYESKKVSGVSHFLEHMLFKGTKKRTTRQIKEDIEGVGGMLNAFTGEEATCYFAKLLVRHFPKAIDVLSDMTNHATLEAAEIAKERTVILEEIKMYRDLPSHHVYDLMGELLWPGQPLGRPVSGTIETVSGLTRTELTGYKKKFYHPKNIIVTVSGPVNHEKTVEQVRESFPEKSRLPVSKFAKAFSGQSGPRTHFVEKQTEQTHFVIGMRSFSRFHPDRYKLGLLNIILGANMSSRLFEEVREKRGLAYEIKSGVGFYHDTGSVSISAGVEAGKAPEAVRVILHELEKLRRKGINEGELRRAKDYFMSQLYMGIEDTLDHLLWVGERALDGELPDRENIRQEIESVKRSDLQDIARNLFVNRGLNFALIGPLPPKVQRRIQEDFEIHER